MVTIDLTQTEYQKTLKVLSYDKDNKVYMTESQISAIDFDIVKGTYSSQLKLEHVASNDALLIHNKHFFIEFKNGKVVPHEIQKKVYDSCYILSKILKLDAASLTESTEFILVYNPDKCGKAKGSPSQTTHDEEIPRSPSLDFLTKTISKKAKEPIIYFGLETLKNHLCSEIHTLTVEEFEEKFINPDSDEWI